MSTSFGQPGDVVNLTAPTGGVTKGVPVLSGGMFVIPTTTELATVQFRGKVSGVHTVAKVTGEGTLAEGQAVFWDAANARITIDSSAGLPLGTMAAAAATGDTTASVRLHGLSLGGRVHTIRKRFTIAQVNAGATLLPAIPGARYRMIDAFMIAIGGAVTTVTTVDILATLSSSRRLVAGAQANLTQSAVLRAGATGGAVLADGASFTTNDVNTAVTVGITGSAITVATHVDFTFMYAIE